MRAERLIPPAKALSMRGQPRLRQGKDFISFSSEEADGKQAALTGGQVVGEEAVIGGVVLLADDVVVEISGVAAKGGVVLLGNLVSGKFTEESVEVGAALLVKDVVCKLTGADSMDTEGLIVDKALKCAADEEETVKVGVVLAMHGPAAEELEIEGVVV